MIFKKVLFFFVKTYYRCIPNIISLAYFFLDVGSSLTKLRSISNPKLIKYNGPIIHTMVAICR